MTSQDKKNTAPSGNGIIYHLKDRESSDLSNIPGIIIRTHYYTGLDIEQTITSREIADLTGRQHKHVLDAVKTMEQAWLKVGQPNFRLTYYIDQWNRQQPQYELSRKECLYIATKFNDEARAILILRWEQLEAKNSLQQSYSEALMLAAKQAEELEKKERQLLVQKPKVLFADAIEGATGSIDVETFSKVLFDEFGIKIGRNSLMKWFRDRKYLTSNNLPYQNVLNRNLMKVKEGTFKKPGNPDPISYTQPRITGKGQIFFANKLMEENNCLNG